MVLVSFQHLSHTQCAKGQVVKNSWLGDIFLKVKKKKVFRNVLVTSVD